MTRERAENSYEPPENVLRFLAAAVVDPQRPIQIIMETDLGKRNIRILEEYITTPKIMEELASESGITLSAVSWTIKRTMLRIWENSSNTTQQNFSPKDLAINKAIFLTTKALDLIQQGRNRQQIMEDMQIDGRTLSRILSDLRSAGHEVPPFFSKSQRLAERIKKERNPDRLRELLKKVTRSNLMSFSKMDEPPVIIFTELAKQVGIRTWPGFGKTMEKVLKDASVPFEKITFRQGSQRRLKNIRFIASQSLTDATMALQNSRAGFIPINMKLAYGKADKIPPLSQCVSFKSILEELGIRRKIVKDIIGRLVDTQPGLPPIFVFRGKSFYILREDAEHFIELIPEVISSFTDN